MNLHWLLPLIQPWRWSLVLCLMLMIGESAASLAMPWLGGQLAGQLLGGSTTQSAHLLQWLVLLLAVQSLFQFSQSWWLGRTAQALLGQLRTRLYDHMQALPMAYHEGQRRGDTISLLTNDVDRLAHFVTGPLLSLGPQLMTVIGAMVLMWGIDHQLAIAVAAALPAVFICLRIVSRGLRPLSQQVQQAHADKVATAEENLGMLPIIKAYTREPQESARYQQRVHRLMQLSQREHLVYAAIAPTVQFLAGAGVVVGLWHLGTGTQSRQPAELVSFLLYAALLTRPMGALASTYGYTRSALGAATRLQHALSLPAESSADTLPPLPPLRGDIRITQLHFQHPQRPPLLQGLELHIHPGETVAITGPNGAGKSSLIQLLLRFRHADSGHIFLDGHDIALHSLRSLRQQIGLVSQNVLLFGGTVRENIAWGQPQANHSAIEQAARMAQAHDFIQALPQGYDSVIGEQGIRLSGGQRQRLALARALLKNPPILVLDEATAMFDPESETRLIEEAGDILRNRTVLIITHRPASLALAQRVYHLQNGRLTDITNPAHP